MAPQLSIVIPVHNEVHNLARLFNELRGELKNCGLGNDATEWIVVDGQSTDGSAQIASQLGAKVIPQSTGYFGTALTLGLCAAKGQFVLCIDADGSHPASTVPTMFDAISNSDIVIGSRFVKYGDTQGPLVRAEFSRLLNLCFASVLRIRVRDMSSGFRLYRRDALTPEMYVADDFNIQQEIVVRAFCAGRRISEVPFVYQERWSGRSKARILRLVRLYLVTLSRLFFIRYFSVTNAVGNKPTEETLYMAGTSPMVISSIPVKNVANHGQ